MSDGTDDVVGVIAGQIEQRFDMSLGSLQAAVAAAPHAHSEATEVVHWYGLLTESQAALERAEDALLAALETQPSEVDDPTMELAHQVNAAVATRDGHAMVVRYLLGPTAPGKEGLAADRLAGLTAGARRGSALQTSRPVRPAAATTPVRGAAR